jgi:hypothetical protein
MESQDSEKSQSGCDAFHTVNKSDQVVSPLYNVRATHSPDPSKRQTYIRFGPNMPR